MQLLQQLLLIYVYGGCGLGSIYLFKATYKLLYICRKKRRIKTATEFKKEVKRYEG